MILIKVLSRMKTFADQVSCSIKIIQSFLRRLINNRGDRQTDFLKTVKDRKMEKINTITEQYGNNRYD